MATQNFPTPLADAQSTPLDYPSPAAVPPPLPRSLGFLLWIAGYKILKAAAAFAGATVALRLDPTHLIAGVHRCFDVLGIAPDGRLGDRIFSRLGRLTPHHLHQAAIVLGAYSILYVAEAVGLARGKRWAEWLTAIQTSLLIPYEIKTLIFRPGPFKLVALVGNVVVVGYLLRRIYRDWAEKKQRADLGFTSQLP